MRGRAQGQRGRGPLCSRGGPVAGAPFDSLSHHFGQGSKQEGQPLWTAPAGKGVLQGIRGSPRGEDRRPEGRSQGCLGSAALALPHAHRPSGSAGVLRGGGKGKRKSSASKPAPPPQDLTGHPPFATRILARRKGKNCVQLSDLSF